jgi:hypothetical protein
VVGSLQRILIAGFGQRRGMQHRRFAVHSPGINLPSAETD